MQAHAIVQIEEGSLNVIVGHRRGAEVVVARSVRFPLADLSRNAVETALRGVSSELLLGASGVHVIIGERRGVHLVATMPRLAAKDALAYVEREALRQASVPSRDDLLLHARLVRRLPGGKLLVAASAFSRELWRPIAEAFAAQQLEVLSLQTMESCLAMAAEAAGPEPVAILECNGNRARFLLCRDGVATQVRRFLISGGSGDNEMALATQLTMELPRTLDWLRESGHPTPTQLVIGSRVKLGDESLQMLSVDEGTTVVRGRLPVVVDGEQLAPDVGVASLLVRLAKGGAAASLLAPARLRMPAGPGLLLSTLAAASVAVLAGFSAVVDGGKWLSQREAKQQLAARLAELEEQQALAGAGSGGADQSAAEASPELEAALCMRRPISRLLAELSAGGDHRVHIEDLRFASKSPVVVVGHVEGSTRQEALVAMAGFRRHIDTLPYLSATGQEEINEMATGFRFKLSLAWRNP